MARSLTEFEWDPVKARTNAKKHGLEFELAATVFSDPFALTIVDEEHSATEARWITLGKDEWNDYVLVIHTFEKPDQGRGRIRIISARRPTKLEIQDYEE